MRNWIVAAIAIALFSAQAHAQSPSPEPDPEPAHDEDPVTGQAIFGNTGRGGAIGAMVGAIGGTHAGGEDGRNATVGAAVGALSVAGIGRYMDGQEEDVRRQTMGSGIITQRVGDNIELTIPVDVSFEKDSANLSTAYLPWLDKLAVSLNQYPQTIIDIVGHTATQGSEQANLSLSLNRANAVRAYLQEKGVLAIRLATGGAG